MLTNNIILLISIQLGSLQRSFRSLLLRIYYISRASLIRGLSYIVSATISSVRLLRCPILIEYQGSSSQRQLSVLRALSFRRLFRTVSIYERGRLILVFYFRRLTYFRLGRQRSSQALYRYSTSLRLLVHTSCIIISFLTILRQILKRISICVGYQSIVIR